MPKRQKRPNEILVEVVMYDLWFPNKEIRQEVANYLGIRIDYGYHSNIYKDDCPFCFTSSDIETNPNFGDGRRDTAMIPLRWTKYYFPERDN